MKEQKIAVILQNVLFRSTPKMARTKHTARKALDGAANENSPSFKEYCCEGSTQATMSDAKEEEGLDLELLH